MGGDPRNTVAADHYTLLCHCADSAEIILAASQMAMLHLASISDGRHPTEEGIVSAVVLFVSERKNLIEDWTLWWGRAVRPQVRWWAVLVLTAITVLSVLVLTARLEVQEYGYAVAAAAPLVATFGQRLVWSSTTRSGQVRPVAPALPVSAVATATHPGAQGPAPRVPRRRLGSAPLTSLHLLQVELSDRSYEDLARLSERECVNKTTVVNRAIQVYSYVRTVDDDGRRLFVTTGDTDEDLARVEFRVRPTSV